MKWKHIMDEQPKDGEQIIQCDPPFHGHHTMGQREYFQRSTWKEVIEGCEKMNWPIPDFWWISAKDFPFPDFESGKTALQEKK